MWSCPELVDFLSELGKIARVILFDKRGTGLSDRVIEFPTLEQRMDDIRAVMDAVDSEKAVLFGHSEGGSVSALFAATYPNRTISLITFGIFAKRVYSPDYPWAPTPEQRQEVYDMIENSWGSGDMNLETLAPSKADDPVFMDWLANYFRSGASPGAALILTKMNTQVDIVDILGSIKVPTLVMQRTDDIDVKIEEGRFITDRIHGAKFVEFDGDDHLFWTGNTEEVLDEMKAFILNVKPVKVYEKQLFTIIVGCVLSHGESSPKHFENLIENEVNKYKGTLVQKDEKCFTATFNGPSQAVYCGMDLTELMTNSKAELKIGIHIKECFADHSVSKEIAPLGTSMFEQCEANQIVLTQTVKNLLIGVNLNFTAHKTVYDSGMNESILLYTVSKSDEKNLTLDHEGQLIAAQTDSFLDRVLQTIDTHLSDEFFNVDILCKELGVSERQLQRKLKAITQKTPNQLISSARLKRAKELILKNDLTVSEVAFQTGFSNPSYFSKCFKKEFDISPSELKS